MFLKNVPPVVALHTEWRSYGPTRNFSLPLCFNDSDSDISTTGTPIPEKVQMIIESLRNTESSIDMSDEYEGTLQTGQAPSPGCTSKTVGVVHKARRRGTLGVAREDNKHVDSMDFGTQSQDSDSDDSVDRGIEEAIQEYLKKKGDHKRKLEPTASPSQVPKHLKRECPFSDTPKNLDGNIILTASSNHIPKNVKKTSSERPSEENSLVVKKGDIIKAVKTFPSFETKKCHINVCSQSNKGQNLSTVKLEEESPDSSSDDGIEEAIRHYQLEKIKENSEDLKKPCTFLQPNEESDSSSDDGIEEAIRHYQLEKQKEEGKHVSKAFKNSHPKQAHGSKAPSLCLDHSGTQAIKKQKVFTKKRKTERNSKPVLSTPVASRHTLSKSLDNPDITDNGISLTKSKILSEKLTPAPLKVNTTAELMCAEAILDISKAVMPEAFTALPNNCVSSTFHSQDRMNCVENKTDESSIDSDDGIEQEIRKFLELKAQMHSQSSGTTNFPGTQEHAMSPQQKRKADPSQNKKLRLSLSHKRKRKEEGGNICIAEVMDSKLQDEHHPQPLAVHDNTLKTQAGASEKAGVALHVATTTKTEEPTKNGEQKHTTPVSLKDAKDLGREGDSHRSILKNEVSKSLMLAERRAQTGDKSSSLDSDEDLDAAIKDLLLTKKKVKRKTRDRKLKSKKCVQFGAVELCLVDELESEKKKTVTDCKTFPSSKITKSCISKSSKEAPKQNTNGGSIKPKLCKNSSEQLKADKQVKHSCQFEQIGQKKGHTDVELLSSGSHLGAAQVEHDSSSVDSDDSIEQEIRKFLAEKAKLSMVRKDGEDVKNISNNPTDSMTKEGVKMEAQQAEIPPTTENLYEVLPYSDVSGQPGCWEREVLKSTSLGLGCHVPQSADKGLSPSVASTSNSPSSLKPDKEVNTVKAVKMGRVSLKNSSTDKTGPGMEKVMSVSKINPVSPSYKTENIYTHRATLPLIQTGVPVSQSPFHISSPMRVRDVHVTNLSDLHVLARETRDSVCPAAGNHKNVNKVESLEPSPQSPNTSIVAVPSFATPTPARQADEDFVLEETRGNSLEQKAAPCPPRNVVHIKMGQPLFLELSSRSSNYVEIKSRDLSKGCDKIVCTREREESKGEGGDLVREGSEECIDETGDESEESPSASQRSRAKKQFPRLILSTTIDPGESFRPYIILNSPERNLRHPKRSIFSEDQQSHNLKMHADTQKQMSQKGPERIHPNYAVNVNTFYSRISPPTVPLTKKAKKKKLVKRKLQFHKY
ncbi:protein phosphatase 1 regulatory subunit 26 isoform X2 [Anguilla anguilla]|uniref:protein phosphatase 1 regulatory subunit 26 isoform X2 n=1 Tax=Anguilla anguilla TaxID=7936 RepID=UPI0015A9825E|nr:protein phosphatase 1 regulatory subunit 26 isoform X2 [Anguilla anguilla]